MTTPGTTQLLLALGAGITGVTLGLLLANNKKVKTQTQLHHQQQRILLLVNGELETAALVTTFRAKVVDAFEFALEFGRLYHSTTSAVAIFSMGQMVGEEAVVTSLALLLSQTTYDLVIVVGCCGTLSSLSTPTATPTSSPTKRTPLNMRIGDIVAAYPTTCFFERRIAAFGPVSKRMGIGETSTWAYTADVARLAEQDLHDASLPTRVTTGKVASGRSFLTDSTGMQWMRDMDVVGKDMESAAAMSTCLQFGVQSTCLKVVVTLVREEEEDMKIEELDLHREQCIPCLARATEAFVHRAQEQLERSKRQQQLLLGQGSNGGALLPPILGRRIPDRLIVIHVAMEEEAKPIAKALGLARTVLAPFARHGMSCWTGSASRSSNVSIVMVSHGTDYLLGMSRVSTQIATLCANIIVSTYGSRLSLVINCGTAGAMSGRHLDIGSVVVASEVKFIDARGLEGRSPPLQVWSDGSNKIFSELQTDVKLGVVGTGSSFDLSPSDLSSLKELDVDVKEMEAASMVWVCNQFHVPVLVVKSVTDFVEHEEEGASEFHENLYGKALDALSQTMPRAVDVVVQMMGV